MAPKIVIGGGIGGLTAAIALARAGLDAEAREAPQLVARSVLSGTPSWLPRGEGRF
jgi:thioredoxin reductase